MSDWYQNLINQGERALKWPYPVKYDEENGYEIVANVEFHPGIIKGVESAFICREFFRIRRLVGEYERRDCKRQSNHQGDAKKNDHGKIGDEQFLHGALSV